MNKITIPALLLGVVMIAGAFAFMPVQEASTVHTGATNLANMQKIVTVSELEVSVTAAQVITIDLDAPFTLLSLSVQCTGGDPSTGNDVTLCEATDETMDIATYVRDDETTAQTVVLTALGGSDTDSTIVSLFLDGNTATAATDASTNGITVADRIAFTMANDITGGAAGDNGFDITVNVVLQTASGTTFDTTDITFS